MEIPILKESGVVFNEQDHTYFLGKKQLQGITSTLVHRVYPHDYDNVSQDKLNERAEYGHKVHDMLEFCITNGLDSEMPEWGLFKQMVDERGYKIIRCEYIVTDFKHYASPIDIVLMREDGKIVLGDIKTNWKAPIEKGTVQLSWYKRRFEEMNPDLEVAELAIFWVRDDQKRGLLSGYYPITPWADEPLDYLIECDLKDEEFDINKLYGNLPAVFSEVEAEVGCIETQVKFLQDKQKTLREGLYNLMEQYNVKSWTGSKVKLTRVLPTESESFDSKAFKEAYPETYKKYLKKTKRAGSLKITLVKETLDK
jgi:hypothetical protein